MTEDHEAVDLVQDIRQKLLVVIINLLVVAELFIAIYRASGNMDEFTPVVFSTFFSLLLPTLALGWLAKRYLSPKQNKVFVSIAEEEQLPGTTVNNTGR